MIPELRLCTTFDLFKALFCHANGIKIETTNSNGEGWISKATQASTGERFEIIPGFNFKKEIRRCQEDYQEKKKKLPGGRSLFSPHQNRNSKDTRLN